MEKHTRILTLFKNKSDRDIILSRLHSVNDILNDCEDDEILNIVQNKVLEAIDWYGRYVDLCDFKVHKSKPKNK
jgi:uncharacterized membrane protein YjjP (DUF1212 family)